MKKTVIATALAAGLLTSFPSAASAAEVPAAVQKASVDNYHASARITATESRYVEALRSMGVRVPRAAVATSIKLGYVVCEAKDAGLSDRWIMRRFTKSLSTSNAAAIIAGATVILCPRHDGF